MTMCHYKLRRRRILSGCFGAANYSIVKAEMETSEERTLSDGGETKKEFDLH